jgi:putative ABC transport system permease protein
MNLVFLTLVNLGRNKLRTLLTFLSVTVALFLFCALFGILDTLQESIKVGSESRIVTRNAISLVFPLPMAYRSRIAALPDVESVSTQNWFGGQDPVNPRNFFAQFAVDAETFFPMYAKDVTIVEASPPQTAVALAPGVDPRLAAFMEEQTACVVGEKLMKRMGWKLGQTVSLNGTIYTGSWPFTIRAVYRPNNRGFGDEGFFFHFRYLDQKGMGGQSLVGLYILKHRRPDHAADVAKEVDALFEISSAATHTETEKAFQAGFVSWYGNLPFVIKVIGLAIVFAILLVAANTMVMAVRERTNEVGVLKTLGFEDGTLFRIVLLEAAFITLGGGVAGSLLAKGLIEWSGFNFGGFLPPMSVYWSTVFTGIAMALLMGAVSGLIPAWQASRLRIVDALRRVD